MRVYSVFFPKVSELVQGKLALFLFGTAKPDLQSVKGQAAKSFFNGGEMEKRKTNKNFSVKKGSATYYILEHLFFSNGLKRKDFQLLLGSVRSTRTIWDSINRLLREGLIKQMDTKPRRIKLTNKGYNLLADKDKYYERNLEAITEIHHQGSSYSQKMEKERDVLTFVAGMDVWCYPKDKPSLAHTIRLLSQDNAEPSVNTKIEYWIPPTIADFTYRLSGGIFYSPREVREVLKKDIGSELIFRSRFNGIMLTSNRLYILYYVNKGLIKWVQTAELALLQTFETLFAAIPQYVSVPPACIAVGSASMRTGIATLVSGFKNGEIAHRPSRDNYERQYYLNFFTARSNLFSEIYYLPLDQSGLFYGDRILSGSKTTRQDEAHKWLAAHDEYLLMTDHMYMAINSEQQPVEYLSVPELKDILSLRESEWPVCIITDLILAEGIAKAIGPKASGFKAIDNNRSLSVTEYDRYGYAITRNEQPKADKSNSAAKRIYLKISEEIYEQAKKKSREKNMSTSQYIASLLEEDLKER